jgi:hypothetical protein
MRTGNDPAVYENNGRAVGFFTGADFCAEHECGTATLSKLLKSTCVDVRAADCASFGIANRMISAELFKRNSVIVRTKKYFALVIRNFRTWGDDDPKARTEADLRTGKDFCSCEGLRISDLVRKSDEKDIVAAWDEGSIGIAVGPKYFEAFDAVAAACAAGYGFLGFSRMLPSFDNGGLVLMDARELPAEVVAKMEADDRDSHALYEEHRRIGIIEKLDAFNKAVAEKTGESWGHTNWHAPYAVTDDGTVYNKDNFNPFCGYGCLRPRWAEDAKTAYKIVYWLNPYDQQQNFFGWVTVEDLLDWMNGTGKIPGRGFGKDKVQRTQDVAAGDISKLYGDEVYCSKCGIVNTKRHDVDACTQCGSADIVYPKKVCYG